MFTPSCNKGSVCVCLCRSEFDLVFQGPLFKAAHVALKAPAVPLSQESCLLFIPPRLTHFWVGPTANAMAACRHFLAAWHTDFIVPECAFIKAESSCNQTFSMPNTKL